MKTSSKKYVKFLVATMAIILCLGVTGAFVYAQSLNDKKTSAAVATAEKKVIATEVTTEITTESKTKLPTSNDNLSANKEETVYGIADASGAVNKVIVSDWIKNSGSADSLTDYFDLNDVLNVKGDESYTMNQDNMKIWEAKGSDIYYQGTTQKTLPVDVAITYNLDGKQISPAELAGKSGKVTIRFNYSNNQKETVDINGEKTDIYVPFIMVTGMILDNSNFKNVEVINGKIINDGNRSIVMGFALPGLKDSLGLTDKDISIPDYVEITADVTEFSLSTTMTVALNNVFNDIKLDGVDDLDDLTKSLSDLSEASEKLVNGTSKLYDGLEELLSNSDDLKKGIDKLVIGSTTLEKGTNDLAAGTSKLTDGTKQLADNMGVLNVGLKTAKTGANSLVSGYEKVNAGTEQLGKGLKSTDVGLGNLSVGIDKTYSALQATIAGNQQILDGLKLMNTKTQSKDIATMISGLETTIATQKQIAASMFAGNGGLKDGVTALQQGSTQLITGALNLEKGIGQLSDGTTSLKDGIVKAYNGSSKLQVGANTINDASKQVNVGVKALSKGSVELINGLSTLQNGSNKLIDGVTQLRDGSKVIKDSMSEFNEKGIKKLVNIFDGDIQKLVDRLNAILDVSKGYQTFAGLSDEMTGSVKFIIKTDEIK